MPASLLIPCPIDGLPLTELLVGPERTVEPRETQLGRHLHMRVGGTAACVNGHKWRASDGFLLQRVP